MILVAGDLMLDVLLLPELKAEEQGAGLLVRSGGSAANTAAWLGHQGAEVTFVGCAGHDGVGAMVRDELRRSGVRLAVRRVAAETGSVAVEVMPDGERVMRSSRGANQMLRAMDLSRAGGRGPLEAIHLTGYALLAPDGLDLLHEAHRLARHSGALLAFDPSSPGVIAYIGAERLLSVLTEAGVRLFLPNIAEAEALTGTHDPAAMALALARRFERVALKTGATGALGAQGRQVTPVRTAPVPAVDTTGAGDAFNAGVLRGLVMGIPLIEAVDEGNRLAGMCVRRYGARPPPPDRADPPR